MYLVVQFPIFDPRELNDKVEQDRLRRPTWPNPNTPLSNRSPKKPKSNYQRQFIRQFGDVYERTNGGLQGFFSEEYLCKANKAIRFPKITNFDISMGDQGNERIRPLVSTRNFYFDGKSTGKFEIGFFVNSWQEKHAIVEKGIKSYPQHILSQMVTIPGTGKSEKIPLIEAGYMLAESFQNATTFRGKSKDATLNITEMPLSFLAGTPLVISLIDQEPDKSFAGRTRSAELGDCKIWTWYEIIQGNKIRFILISEPSESASRQLARNLRVFLSRVHAELTVIQFSLLLVEATLDKYEKGQATDEQIEFIRRRLNWIEDERLTTITSLSTRIGKAARALLKQSELEIREVGDSVLSTIWGSRIAAIKDRFYMLRARIEKTVKPQISGAMSTARLKIFISYRRDDSGPECSKIVEHLRAYFPNARIYHDVASIEPGTVWRANILKALLHGEIALVMMGEDWQGKSPIGESKIQNPEDIVRLECEVALDQELKVLPVLIGGASFPEDIPASLDKISSIDAFGFKTDVDIAKETSRLAKTILAL